MHLREGDGGAAGDGGGDTPEWARHRMEAPQGMVASAWSSLIHIVAIARASVGIGVLAQELINLHIRPRELLNVGRGDVQVNVLLELCCCCCSVSEWLEDLRSFSLLLSEAWAACGVRHW